ncbi:ABC transporter ATP-binding protein [Pectobacterium brasiliense]|uniref:ABC transporter ATP-binding protein n=2 Tax=Pectobacterium brasiliense TaxID=180957 RepID=UPI0005804315|nr:ABC transporter ATP-binding protein [Pectobacterium brasiliense]APS29419.1 ABC transporter [Pectobacterium brasiliense]KHS98774.1 ABC transporter [Pectobacterium brasiliense]MBN3097683.1 ABC transporter ATP-binding protein [Pectobacterium brasiliense]MBN3101234.1 ABC transporter ATP-binding protein [Pectobacterium brasiliense]MBN3163640.1 ABC transporter ATP-binding protein [Pectobacterium brasiliense]
MSEATLVLNNVHVAYGHKHNVHHVLNGFSMEVAAGELACLLGASGCGKTTALRAIAGFEHLTQGTIHVGGRCVAGPDAHLPPEQRNVGMVFQDYALFPHLTAAQNIAFGLRKQPKNLQQSRVRAMLELVDLVSLAQRYPHEMSGGQQQRIALARALAPQPAVLLLDEPLSSLDPDSRKRLGQEVRDILRDAGQTALLVTHSEQEAELMASHIGYLKAGTLEWRERREKRSNLQREW